MSASGELRVLRGIVLAIAIGIALTVGPMAAFGGMKGMALLFGAPTPSDLDLGLRNHLRAICACWAGFGALAAWSLYALEERKNAFRIVCVTIFLAGGARIVGWITEGYPGWPAMIFLSLELGLFPLLLAWHTRLVKRMR